jgi:hypothetical protein
MNNVYMVEMKKKKKKKELPLDFEVIGYPPCQCPAAAQSGIKDKTKV